MIECIPEHVGKSKCPECGEAHRHYDFLPDSMLSVTQCKQIRNESDVDEIYPIFEVHDPEERSFTSVPAVIVVEGDEFTVVYYDTTEDEGWGNGQPHQSKELRVQLRSECPRGTSQNGS
jgi:hypothetical protein